MSASESVTTTFYAPPTAFRGTHVSLPDDEAHHAIRVLRKKAGDEIVVVDGVGGWHRVRLDYVDRRRVQGEVLETKYNIGEPGYHLSIGLALLKNRNRYETFLEKAVELGASTIIPLLSHRAEKASLKQQRAENILMAAMKQSGRSRLVHLTDPQPLDDLLGSDADLKLLCHEQADPAQHISAVLTRHPAQSICILIGPEGGFADQEVEAATEAGFHIVSLGARRLRAETAAIVAATAVMLHAG